MKSLTKARGHFAKGIYSINTKGKSMNTQTFFNQITNTLAISIDYHYKADHGFYKVGVLLNKAKLELGTGGYGKLKKQLQKNKFHIKMQERYASIARDKRIANLYSKMPPQWTFWEKLTHLSNQEFAKIKHLINNETQWKEIAIALGYHKPIGNGKRTRLNERDNRTEIFGFEYDYKTATKKHKSEFEEFTLEVNKLAKKYKFIKLNKKNYFDEALDILSKDVDDDTSKQPDEVKFKKSYNSKRKIDI